MKRLGGVFDQVVDFANLHDAWRKARRGKRNRESVARFSLQVERELFQLQDELCDGSWRPGAYRLFTINDRKPRTIAAAPFRDRVVHHAIMNVIEPSLDRTFIDDSYACRRGRGVHRAVDRYQGWAERWPYVLKLDVARYFPSIDHELLKAKLSRRIKDRRVLQLLFVIIDGSPETKAPPIWVVGDDLFSPLDRRRGIPIGNLTSQFFANLYLDALDHYIKQELRVGPYLRYVDDMILLGDSAAVLRGWRARIEWYLREERLLLHARKREISRTADGLDVFGYRIFRHRRRLRADNGYRFRRRLEGFARAYAAGRLEFADFDPSVQSWLGHARHGETAALRESIFSGVIFSRGAGRTKARA